MHSSRSMAERNPASAFLAAFTLFAMLVTMTPRPARADRASTTAVLLGAAAAAAAIIISNNVRRKAAQANTPVGRTQDGGTILGNGRVVYPNGDVLYTGNGNGQPCRYDGYGYPCDRNPQVYYPRSYNGGRHDNGNHYGQYKHRHRDDEDGGDRERGGYGKHGNKHGDKHDD